MLCNVPDTRKRRGVRHKIQSLMATAICAVLAGARSFTAMGEWAAEQSRETLERLGSKRGKAPSERTYRRLFDSIGARVEWVARLLSPLAARLAQMMQHVGASGAFQWMVVHVRSFEQALLRVAAWVQGNWP